MDNYLNYVDVENKENKENRENLDGLLLPDVKGTEHFQNEVGLSELVSKPFECGTCDFKTVRSDCLKVHLQIHVEKTLLTEHAKTHVNDNPFVCKICNSSFTTKSNLQTHARTHIGEKPFVCQVCGHRTTSNTALKKHLKVIHIEPYGCGICDSSFADKVSLKDHLGKIHSIQS